MSSLTFNGKTAASFGLRIGGVNVYDAQEREVQLYTVPGRIGAVYPALDLSQIPNEVREYSAALYMRASSDDAVQHRMANIRDWLMNSNGYAELSDSYEPDLYRRAFFTGNFAPIRKGAGQNFEIPLRFSCDPRRFISGNHDFTLDGTQGDVNYTTPETVDGFTIREACKPLIYISKDESYNTVNFTDATTNVRFGQLLIKGYEEDFWFDCETLTAWVDDVDKTPCNEIIDDVIGEIRLGPGPTKISFLSAMMSMRFYPRWWVR